MEIINRELILTKDELIKMIEKDNLDKNDWSKDTLINMITNYEYFSKKQYEWILSKIKYIVSRNFKYKVFRNKFKSFDIDK